MILSHEKSTVFQSALKLKLRSRSLSDEDSFAQDSPQWSLTLLLDTATDGLMNGMTWHHLCIKGC